jgi:hypothetical protein
MLENIVFRKKIYTWAILLFNFGGIVISFLYGMFGGVGGDTTEGVFIGFVITGFLSFIAILIFGIFQFKIFSRNIYWLIPILIINYFEVTAIHLDILFRIIYK